MSTDSNCLIPCSSGASCGLSGGICYAATMPTLCSGALIQVIDSDCTPDSNTEISGAVIYSGGAVYNIGRLRSILPGYNPANTGLKEYAFTSADLMVKWIPAIFEISGGIIISSSSGGVASGGTAINAVCQSSYNEEDNPHWIISWHEPAAAAGARH